MRCNVGDQEMSASGSTEVYTEEEYIKVDDQNAEQTSGTHAEDADVNYILINSKEESHNVNYDFEKLELLEFKKSLRKRVGL